MGRKRKYFTEEERKTGKNKSNQKWRDNNKEKRKIYDIKFKKNHPIYMTTYMTTYMIMRRHTDINFKIAQYLRNRLGRFLKNNKKHGMSWDNWGKWHIDHIIPLSSFNLQDRKEFLKACHYTNLQPLWAKENLSKKNKIIQGV